MNLEGEYSWVGGEWGGVDKVWKKYEVQGYSRIGGGGKKKKKKKKKKSPRD